MASSREFVCAFRDLLSRSRNLAPPRLASHSVSPAASGPAVLVFSPHPDDECITGGLPLRLQREAGARVINVPVTFGSMAARRAARRDELKKACAHLGFELAESGPDGVREPEEMTRILRQIRPAMIFFPHAEDWNRTHERVHHLVMEALPLADADCLLVETEYWRPMKQPNLMVEISADDLTVLVAALSLHTGEVARNPYHLLLPAWMMDNVRRGGEVVSGQGAAPPPFTFATLYRLSRWAGGRAQEVLENGRLFSSDESVAALLDLSR